MTLVLKLRFVVAMLVVTVKEPASPVVPVSMNTGPNKYHIPFLKKMKKKILFRNLNIKSEQ